MAKTSKAAPEKKAVVKRIQELGGQYPIVAVLNMENLPASSLLKMKKQLRGKVELVMTRKTLLIRGLKQLNLKNGDKVIEKIVGMPALMFTKENPFELYKIIKKSKTPAPAKPGQLAPRDIVLPAGPTPFTPGPVISEFAGLGVPAGVEEGKVAIKEETLVVKEGEEISGPLSSMLGRLGIKPMEIGLDLVCAYDKGVIYGRSVLDIDEDKFMADFDGAIRGAFNLAIDIILITKDTIEALIGKAHRGARSVGIEGAVPTPELAEEILAKAQRQAKSVASEANIDIK